jgi:ribosomal protein L17
MLHHLIAAAASDGGVTFDNPLILGPLAAFVFAIFVSEVVVPGKTYRREVDENARLRDLVEHVIPLAESMTATAQEMVSATTRVTDVMDRVVNTLADPRRNG